MTSDPPDIRQLGEADLDAVFSMDVSSPQVARYVVGYSERPPGLLLQRRGLAMPLDRATWGRNECESRRELWIKNLREGASMWGAFVNGILAGFVLISPLLPNRTVEVFSLFVDAATRRNGIGSLLMQQAEEHARKLSAEGIHLSTMLENAAAIDFYLHSGYQVAQLADGTVLGEGHSGIRFAKRLA
jgi:ribosomal protein S18 acetylase RimI-like enzyme